MQEPTLSESGQKNKRLEFHMQMAAAWHSANFAQLNAAKFVVGVSGGADSVALWHWLIHSSGAAPEQVLAVCVDHQMRPGSLADAHFVMRMAENWGVSAELSRLEWEGNQPKLPLPQSEAAARIGRYACLAQAAHRFGSRYVLTAHHLADQAETILMHLLRGSGLAGLRGMRPFSGWPYPNALASTESPLQLVRPMLQISKQEIIDYVEAHHLVFVDDPSNSDPAYTRNRIRHQLMPILQSYNPQVEAALGRMGQLLSADYELVSSVIAGRMKELVDDEGPGWLRIGVDRWRSFPAVGQHQIVRAMWAHVYGGLLDLTSERVEAAVQRLNQWQRGGQIDLGRGIILASYDELAIMAKRELLQDQSRLGQLFGRPQLVVTEPTRVALTDFMLELQDGWQLTVEAVESVTLTEVIGGGQNRWQAYIAIDDLSTLHVRGRLEGERFVPLGAGGSTKVKNFMIDHYLPMPLRSRWPILADHAGLLWIGGWHIAQRAAIAENEGRPIIKVTLFKRESAD